MIIFSGAMNGVSFNRRTPIVWVRNDGTEPFIEPLEFRLPAHNLENYKSPSCVSTGVMSLGR